MPTKAPRDPEQRKAERRRYFEKMKAERPEKYRAMRAASLQRRRARDPEKAAAKRKAHRARAKARDPEAFRALKNENQRRIHMNNPLGTKRRHARERYGLTNAEYDALHAAYTACPLCGNAAPPVIDHCHDMNIFRGLLCDPCNRALGAARDRPDVLRRMADYVEAARVKAMLS